MKDKRIDKIEIDGETFKFSKALSGRGQAGMAGFYESTKTGKLYLIKEDNPGTCFAESLAITHNPYNEKASPPPIIQAKVAVIEKEGKSISISMQEAFSTAPGEKIQPFDLYVLGHKREPKTWISEEWYNSSTIKNKIGDLSDTVKKQLAEAIYNSQINGDESLHTAQFMISVNDKDQVTSIKRIDFGALGRYGMARQDFDPMHTSSEYASSGQWGKDYVSYLLQDKTVAHHVNELWKRTDPKEIIKKVGERFSEQIARITNPKIRETALLEFNEALSKGTSYTLPSNGNPEVQILLNTVAATDRRCEGYHAKAVLSKQADAGLTQGNIERLKEIKAAYQLDRISTHDTEETASLSDSDKESIKSEVKIK